MTFRLQVLGLIAVALTAVPAVRADAPAKPATTDKTATSAPAVVWESARVTSPDSVDELKALQAKVKQVYQKALPTTVALLLGGDVAPGGSAGSGVIVGEDGLVLTAAHVIGRPREPVQFVLSDGRVVKGVSLGLNSQNDSGMARITDPAPPNYPGAKDGRWPVSPVGPSADMKKGQWIVSLGHPGGPKRDRPPPVRIGRFLGLDKANRFDQYNDLLRTDATLVGGDSGGPLFDLDGRMVGIHSQIGETLDQNQHVPSEKFKAEWDLMVRGDIIFQSARARERATKVTVDMTFEKGAQAAKVEEVVDGGAADKAGIEAGDVIAKFNGNPVKSAEDLFLMLPSYRPDEKVKVEVTRGGNPVTLDLKLSKKK